MFHKEFESYYSCPCYTREKKLNKLKMNDFPLIYQRTKVRESTTTVKPGDTDE